MSLRLRPLEGHELVRYRGLAEVGYADSISEHAGMPRPLAEAGYEESAVWMGKDLA